MPAMARCPRPLQSAPDEPARRPSSRAAERCGPERQILRLGALIDGGQNRGRAIGG